MFQLRSIIFASHGQFSDNGCVSIASLAAEGQRISWVPPSSFRYDSCVPGY